MRHSFEKGELNRAKKVRFWNSLLGCFPKFFLSRTPCSETLPFIKVPLLDNTHELWNNKSDMALPEQKKKLLKAKIAVALQSELGRVPTEEEINNIFLQARVMYKAVLGLHFLRQKKKKTGQLAIF